MTYSELRASDAERERVVAFLREHALLGRLTDDELEERIGLAYASVTVGDLEKLIHDLPRTPRASSPARPRTPARAATRRRQHTPPPALIGLGIGALLVSGVGFAAVAVVLAVAVALIATVFALSVVLGPILLVALLVVAASKRHSRPRGHWRPQY